MATYVIETYLSRARPEALAPAIDRLREAIAVTSTPEAPIHHVRSFFVPEDEICSHVVEAPSIGDMQRLSRRAGLQPDRIVEATS